jgi:CubicO group peptidase (beta-lactamase class C family)
VIPAAPPGAAPLPSSVLSLGNPRVTRLDGSAATLDDVLAGTFTDAFLVLHDGQVVAERYYDGMTAGTRHLLMSVSKSILGCVVGVLTDRGLLDTHAPVTAYVPEAARSGYAGATIRDLLDMRTGVAFREIYTAPSAEVRMMERSMGWRPMQPGDPQGAYPYLLTLGSAGPHGGEFHYRSADSDMLGWACERASGIRIADLVSALVWRPIGAEADAEITCDPLGSAIPDGGISATARDLARFGQVLVDDGVAQGQVVVPEAWLADVRSPEPSIREAFACTDNEAVLPGGWYRSQFWVIPRPGGPVLVCLGIHGQLIYADRASRTVVVKMSAWPDAQNAAYLLDTLGACAAVADWLSAAITR